MRSTSQVSDSRRKFLRHLALSPALASPALLKASGWNVLGSVSNHGGRAEESLRSTIECLPEVVDAVKGKVPVLIDGGIRRGTDVFKALALGAIAVGIGRPYAWGLAAFGQPGVEAVLAIMRRELETIMRQAGTPSVAGITKAFVMART